MKKLFISQPMGNKTDEEILRVRNEAIKKAESIYKEKLSVINSFLHEDGKSLLWYLGKSIILMSDADIVYFVKGFGDAKGCRVEYKAAKEYGLNIIIE